jgi:hypothetical protein
MKPLAPKLVADDITVETPSIESEMLRLCEEQAPHSRITIPAPPTEEALRLATPVPPPEAAERRDTTPAPPPSSIRRRADTDEMEAVPSTIPGPPRLPNVAV